MFSADLVEQVLEGLASPDRIAQALAARILDEHGTPDDTWAIEPLRRHLVAALVPDSTINRLELRATIIPMTWALGLVGDVTAVGTLVSALMHPDERLAWAAATALGEIGDRSAIRPLTAQLEQRPGAAFAATLGTLHAVDARETMVALVETLADTSRSIEGDEDDPVDLLVGLSDALGHIGRPVDRASLMRLLGHSDETLRLHAAIALSRLGDDGVMPEIVGIAIERLGGYRSRRWFAARRLAELGDPRGPEAMRDIYMHRDRLYDYRDNEVAARHAMLRDLGRHGNEDDVALLDWIARHDHATTDQGWTLADAATRSILRIEARHRRHRRDPHTRRRPSLRG